MYHAWIIGIALPCDTRTKEKERKKMEKYQDLAGKTLRLWKTSVNVIPIVVRALETVTSLDEY